MSALTYRSHGRIDDLAINECTVHRASGSGSARWWQLWFNVLRDSDGQPEVFCVPINPGGTYTENGPGGRTWGISKPQVSTFEHAPGTSNWMVSPSINVLGDRDAVEGTHEHPSLWHQTPEVLNVPDDEAWATGSAP